MNLREEYQELSNMFIHEILDEPDGQAFSSVSKEKIDQLYEQKEIESMHFWRTTKEYDNEADAVNELTDALVNKYKEIISKYRGKNIKIYWRIFPSTESLQDFDLGKPMFKSMARGTAVVMEDEGE